MLSGQWRLADQLHLQRSLDSTPALILILLLLVAHAVLLVMQTQAHNDQSSWASTPSPGLVRYFEIFCTSVLTVEISLRIFAHTPRKFFLGRSISTPKTPLYLDFERIANIADFALTIVDLVGMIGLNEVHALDGHDHNEKRAMVMVGGHMTGSLAKVAGRSVSEVGRLMKLALKIARLVRGWRILSLTIELGDGCQLFGSWRGGLRPVCSWVCASARQTQIKITRMLSRMYDWFDFCELGQGAKTGSRRHRVNANILCA